MNKKDLPIVVIVSAIVIFLTIYAVRTEKSVIIEEEDKYIAPHYAPVEDYKAVSVIRQFDKTYLTVGAKSTGIFVETAEKSQRYKLTDEEKHMLCYVADLEDYTSAESRQAVMQVVMNRTENEKFPDTVKDVLYATKQFPVINNYSVDYEPSDEAVEALERLLHEDDIFSGEQALFFARADISPSKIARGLQLVCEIGGSRFYSQE